MYISLSLYLSIYISHTLYSHTHTPLLSDNSSRRTHLTLTHTHLLHKYLTQHISHTLTQLLSPASPRQSKCCACHAKEARDAQSAAPATQMRAVPPGDQTRTGKSQRVKVLRLPRKSSGRCTKCCACHANARGPSRRPNAHRQVPDSQSAAPATQK